VASAEPHRQLSAYSPSQRVDIGRNRAISASSSRTAPRGMNGRKRAFVTVWLAPASLPYSQSQSAYWGNPAAITLPASPWQALQLSANTSAPVWPRRRTKMRRMKSENARVQTTAAMSILPNIRAKGRQSAVARIAVLFVADCHGAGCILNVRHRPRQIQSSSARLGIALGPCPRPDP